MVHLSEGVGVSVVDQTPEELVYLYLHDISMEYTDTGQGMALNASIRSIQLDNQLVEAERTSLLFVMPPQPGTRDHSHKLPALHFTTFRNPQSPNMNVDSFKHLMLTIKPMSVMVEERVVWKLIKFLQVHDDAEEVKKMMDETEIDAYRAVGAATSADAKRYYFQSLKLQLQRLHLSVLTTSLLPPALKALKRSMGVHLVQFEGAHVELDPFCRSHRFETARFLVDEVCKHYGEELKSQAAKILGSVDFLGNPLGLINDVTEGVTGLIQGNVGGFFKHLTHGVSNTTAKVTGVLGDQVGKVSMDDKHEEVRRQIRVGTGTTGGTAHFMAGLKGLGVGIVGGVTSVLSQTYQGAASDGVEGFFTGFAKGAVGTITKPVVGMLDFATGTANAIRDTSRRSYQDMPPPRRCPRLCQGPGHLLPRYSESGAKNQSFLHTLNERRLSEVFMSYETLRRERGNTLACLVSSQTLYFLQSEPPHINIYMEVAYSKLWGARWCEDNNTHYIELTMPASSSSMQPVKRSLIRCSTKEIAQRVTEQVMYAKGMYDEKQFTVSDSSQYYLRELE